MYCNSMPKSGMNSRYSGMSGLSETFSTTEFKWTKPTNPAIAIEAIRRMITGNQAGFVGTYAVPIATWANKDFARYPEVYNIDGKLYAIANDSTAEFLNLKPDAFTQSYTMSIGTPESLRIANIAQWKMKGYFEMAFVGELVKSTDKKTTTDSDCPPPDNCTEKWVDKTLYVSAKPVKDAIEIPVAFKKLVCEGESTEDPQIDCEELLKALEQSVSEGQVPGMVNGLGAVPANYPPDWCKDCEEKLVKASAYVTDFAVAGSKPFKVKVKVLVCETNAEPKIDCDEVVKALVNGMRAKRTKTVNGLSEATATSSENDGSSGNEFDREAGQETEKMDVKQAGFPWWLWLVLGGTALYAARKL